MTPEPGPAAPVPPRTVAVPFEAGGTGPAP